MAGFKERFLKFRYRFRTRVSSKDPGITFVVPDRESCTSAKRALSRVQIPKKPRLRMLRNAYSFGDSLVDRLRGKIKIVEQKGIPKEDTYRANESILNELVELRNLTAESIEMNMQPAINVVGELSIQCNEMWKRFERLEKRIRQVDAMMLGVYGKAPMVPGLPGGKRLWGKTVKKAVDEVIRECQTDFTTSGILHRSLREISDEFFDNHTFIRMPHLEKSAFYESVKKANNPWGKPGKILEESIQTTNH